MAEQRRIIPVCPECRAGKCPNCDGSALDETSDEIVACECRHGGMNEDELLMAKQIYEALHAESAGSDRSLQAADFKVGISDVGYCAERTRRMLGHQVPEATDLLAAIIGTAVGEFAERAVAKHLWPDALIQAEVRLTLRLLGKTYRLPGHPDVVRPDWGIVDFKTDYGLSTVEREGPSFSQEFQRHGYAMAAHEAGMFGDMPLEKVMVANAWIDRTAKEKRPHVQARPFDPEIIQQGIEWLESVLYAHLNDEEAMKEPPRDVCRVTCGFFGVCREWETDVHGLLEGVEGRSLDQYADGLELERQGRKLKDEAKAHLEGVSGSNGRHTIRHTWVNPSEVPGYQRAGYYKIDVKPVKKR